MNNHLGEAETTALGRYLEAVATGDIGAIEDARFALGESAKQSRADYLASIGSMGLVPLMDQMAMWLDLAATEAMGHYVMHGPEYDDTFYAVPAILARYKALTGGVA